jgi:hypothetical protein
MKPKSIQSLMWFSIILLLLGVVVMSPVVALLIAMLTIICALALIFFGPMAPRVVGLAVLVASIGLVAIQYQDASQQLKTFKNHVKKADVSVASVPLTNK